jgi:hypothetical protein
MFAFEKDVHIYHLPLYLYLACYCVYPNCAHGKTPRGLQDTQSELSKSPDAFLMKVLDSDDLGMDESALVRRLIEVAADARGIYLDRIGGMDPSERPRATEIDRIAALPGRHIEAIVLHAVLNPRQHRRWRRIAEQSFPPPRRIALSDTSFRKPESSETYSEVWYALCGNGRLRGWSENCGLCTASDLFRAMLDSDGNALPNLTPRQLDVIKRLNILVQICEDVWLRQGLSPAEPTPEEGEGLPTATMLEKLSGRSVRIYYELAGRAEVIALEVVLNSEQAEVARLLRWALIGVYALSDAELSQRLSLSREQRSRIHDFLSQRQQRAQEIFERTNGPSSEALLDYNEGRKEQEELERLISEDNSRYRTEITRLDEQCWSILHSEQRRIVRGLLEEGRHRLESARRPVVVDD